MTVKKAKKLLMVIFAITSIVLIYSFAMDPNPAIIDSYDSPILIFFALVMVITVIIAFKFLRCPNCGKSLSKHELNSMVCSRCGHDLDK